jgi:hypothetical protein
MKARRRTETANRVLIFRQVMVHRLIARLIFMNGFINDDRFQVNSGSIFICVIGNLGMEKRPRRFSLSEAFFEGSHFGGREDCPEHAECKRKKGISAKGRNWGAQIKRAEFRSAEKKASGTALRA